MIKSWSSVLAIKHADEQIDMAFPLCVQFLHLMQNPQKLSMIVWDEAKH
jgi:hypothetical protein